MLDDTFLADELTVARDTIRRPPAPSKPSTSFSLWRLTTATSRGSAAGVLQVGAAGLDVAGAFGSVTVASGLGDPLLADQPRLQEELLKVQRDGLEFSNPISDRLRSASRWVAPDPETAHVAERIVFDATRVVTKGVTYVATTGPFAAAALTGVDEALTFSDDLKQQGVDRATRTKAAAVVGGVTGASVAAPVAGRTLLGTVGLVAATGPAAFIGQQAAVREILSNANYSSLAEQFDPFDPVGLAVSTLVPAAFGAWGLRGSRRGSGRGPEAGTAEPAAPTAHEALGPAVDEAVDAAHVVLASEAQARSAIHRPGDPVGNAARERAVDRAAEQLSDGQPVRVSDLVDAVDMPAGRAALKEIDALRAEREQLLGRPGVADAAVAARLQVIDAQVQELSQRLGPAMEMARMEQGLAHASESIPVAPPDGIASRSGSIERVDVNLVKRKGVDAIDVNKTLAQLPAVKEGWVRLFRGESPTTKFADVFDVSQLTSERAAHIPGKRYTTDIKYADYYRSSYGRDATLHYVDVPQAVADRGRVNDYEFKLDLPSLQKEFAAGSLAPPTAVVVEQASPLDRLSALSSDRPGLLVHLDDMDAPAPMAEVVDRLRSEVRDLEGDADLMRIAAECAISNGV